MEHLMADAFEEEPSVESPLLTFPQVVLPPSIAGLGHGSIASLSHGSIASLSHGSISEMTRRGCGRVATVAHGAVPVNSVDPTAAEKWR